MKKILSIFIAWMMLFALVFSFSTVARANGQSGTTLTAEKTAQGFRGTVIEYDWAIEKSVSPSSIEISQGESATVTYTLTATRTQVGSTEGTGVEGQICVENGGSVVTENLKLVDQVQYKTGAGQFHDLSGASQTIIPSNQLNAGESHCYPYKIEFSPVDEAIYRNSVQVTITNHSGHLGEEFGPNPKAEFSLPESTSTTYIDAEADIMDIEDNISGLSYNLIDTGDGIGPWHLTNCDVISFNKEITNDRLCGEDVNFGDTVSLTESDTQALRTDTASVDIGIGTCSQEDLCSNLDGIQTEVPIGYTRDSETNTCSLTSTPTPTPTVAGGSSGSKKKTKITPQVLGTTAPAAEELPVTGADYTWVSYFILIAGLLGTYYLKQIGWAKISR